MTTNNPTITHSRAVDKSPVFYGWVVWAVATLGMIATSPGQSFSVSLFNDHFINDFDMTRTTVSGFYGLGTFIASLSLTWMGRQMDIYGSRRIGTIILTLFAMVLMSLSVFITGPLTLLLAFFAIRFLGQGSLGLVSNTAIARWWRYRRGWVASLAIVGFALWQGIYLPLLRTLINDFGWRATWVILGATVAVIVLPLWWLLMRDLPEKYGLLPDGEAVPVINDDTPAPPVIDDEDNWRLREAMRTPMFWIFIIGRMIPAAWGTGLIFHQVSIFAELGYGETVVTETYGLISLMTAGSTLIAGRIIGILPRPSWMMSVQLGGLVLASFLAMFMRESWMLWVYALLFGIMMGTAGTFDGTVWADVFGRLYLGEIRGFSSTASVAGTSVGPLLFGMSFDTFASYDAVLWGGIAIALVPLVACLFLTRPRRRIPLPLADD